MGQCCSSELASGERGGCRRYVGMDEETPPRMHRRQPRERRGGGGGAGGGGGGGGGAGGGGRRVGGGRRGRGRGGQEDTVPLPFLVRLFAPRQRTINDLPIIVFDVNDDEPRYKAVMDAIKVRQCAFAPDVIGHNVPICRFPNPETGESHYFIIRLTNGMNSRFMVDLLLRDTDLYFIGFRRHRILSEDERADVQAHRLQINEGPGIWYRFGNERLPACLNTEGVSIGTGSGHTGDKTTPGGRVALEEIFITLSLYEDRGANKEALRKAVQRVIVTFCEATRLRSVYQEMAKRIRLGEPGSELSDGLWKLIHSWQVLSGKALTLRKRGQMGLDTQLPADLDDLDLYGFNPGIHTVASLIGPEGELMLLNRERNLLIEDHVLEERTRQVGSSLVEEPNFPGDVDEKAGEIHG